MTLKFKYLIPALIVMSCTGNKKADDSTRSRFAQPKTVEANPEGGYQVNQVTGDSIQPIIVNKEDTLVTGIPIEVKGITQYSDSLPQPKSFVVPTEENLLKINADANVYQIPKNLTVVPVNQDALTVINLENIADGDTTHFIINSIGDTIRTGVPQATQGKSVPLIQPKPTRALSPGFKDAAKTNIQFMDVDQGMSSSYIWSILEDSHGNLWFGTDGGGVSRYDGETYLHFTAAEGLSDNKVLSIFEDSKGNLWFGTDGGGLSRYDGEGFTHYSEEEGLTYKDVWSILEDANGDLWFATDGGGVSRYHQSENGQDESFTHFTTKEGLSGNYVWSMIEDSKGNLWFGTYGNGLTCYDGEKFTQYNESNGLINNYVLSILEDEHGILWLGTFGGMCSFDGEKFTYFTELEGLSNNIVLTILQDEHEDLWFGTYGGGVTKLVLNDSDESDSLEEEHFGTFTHFTEAQGLSNNFVRSIFEDAAGNLWFGTYGGGVSIYDQQSYLHFTETEGLLNNIVLSISEDAEGNIWFATDGGGVCRYDGEHFTQYFEAEGLERKSIWKILRDSHDNLWFGTYGSGAVRYDGETFTYFSDSVGLSDDYIMDILEDRNGNLWFGTWGAGISRYDPSKEGQGGSFTHFTEENGLNNNYIWSILEDDDGNLWFGTFGGGVSRYDGKHFTYFTEAEGLGDNAIRSMFKDNNGNLWFGSEHSGVSRYDGKSFVHFTKEQGLSDNIVRSIFQDNNSQEGSNIWVSTENGLNNIVYQAHEDGSIDPSTINIFNYGKEDGLRAADFYLNSSFLDSKNRAWWGGGKGLTMLDLNNHSISKNPPKVYLKQLDINEQFIDYRNIQDSIARNIEFDEVQPFFNYPLNLKVPYDQNHLTFHFAGIDWEAPHKVQYSYLLDGLDRKWSKPSSESKADYRNIPHGAYAFKVRAIGESGEWSEAFEYRFSIYPPWWHTWWARALYVLFGLSIVMLVFRLRTRHLKKRQRELEHEVDLATKEIMAQKTKVESTLKEVESQKELIEQQKEQVEVAHKEITDSIIYAERIQRSFLATKELLDTHLNDYFVYFNPKEAVSGDFYWAGELANGNFAVSCADSTGHGVPGAIMSILNISAIESAVKEQSTDAASIFNKARTTIIERLKKDGSEEGGKDGMDASLLILNPEKTKLEYVAANNPIWIYRGGELIDIKGEKMPVGKHENDKIPFEGGEIELQIGDIIYAITDGFQDQFGGEKGKKFKVKPMKEMLLNIAHLPMQQQHEHISNTFNNWAGSLEQVDDVCIVGIKI